MRPREPIFLSDGEVDPISHIGPPKPPRVPNEPWHPLACLIALLLMSGGVFGGLWLLASWILT